MQTVVVKSPQAEAAGDALIDLKVSNELSYQC